MVKSILLIVMFLSWTQVQAADTYKWVDESGITQYTATPPPFGVPYTTLHKPPPPSQDPKAVMQQLKEQLNHDETAKTQVAGEQDEARSKNCEISRENLKMLESPNREVIGVDDKGEKYVLNKEQREAKLSQTRKDVDYYCNP